MAQDVNATKAQMPGVPDDVEKNDAAGPALGGEHPVASPGVVGYIALAAEPDVETVQGVVENRQPDPEQLQVENKREAGEQFDLLGVRPRAPGSERIGDEMLNQKRSYRNDAAE